MKVTGWTWVVGVLALGCLGLGYFLAVAFGLNITLWVPIVGLVCVGTALAFLGLAALYLHFSRKNEARLYCGANLITVSQLMHRYRGNVGALSTIAITTTVALCAVLCCCGLFGKTLESSRVQRPFSMEIRANKALEDLVEQAAAGSRDVNILSRTPIEVVRVKATNLDKNATYQIISQSQYNAVANVLGWREQAEISGDDSAMLVLNPAIGTGTTREIESLKLPVGAGEVQFTVVETRYRTYVSLDRFIRSLVVTDRMYGQIASTAGAEKSSLVGYQLDEDMHAEGFLSSLRAAWPEDSRMYTFYEYYRDSYKLMGVLMFVGVFVGLLFITATGSILYFRMSMDAVEDREKFLTLIKLGIGKGQLKAAIARELAIVFGAPLALAVVNSFMASVPLGKMVSNGMADIFAVIVAVYTLVYGLYFLMTLSKYIRTISN
jgi:putative ABC transport system permease protein